MVVAWFTPEQPPPRRTRRLHCETLELAGDETSEETVHITALPKKAGTPRLTPCPVGKKQFKKNIEITAQGTFKNRRFAKKITSKKLFSNELLLSNFVFLIFEVFDFWRKEMILPEKYNYCTCQ